MNANQFRAAMSALGPLPPDSELPPRFSWERNRIELRRHALKNNPNRFLTWSTVQAPMHIAHWTERTKPRLEELRADDWQRWKPAVQTAGFGDIAPISANLTNQAYHIMRWERATGARLDKLETIVEFGGGYGAMALVARRLGFEGDYWIYDLPELSLLQRFFLAHHGVDAHFVTDDTDQLPERTSLLIGIYSISEAPLEVREAVLSRLEFDHAMLCYQPEFFGVDNEAFFSELMRDGKVWSTEPIYHGTYVFA